MTDAMIKPLTNVQTDFRTGVRRSFPLIAAMAAVLTLSAHAAPPPTPSGKPNNLTAGRTTVPAALPRSGPPASTLLVLDTQRLDNDWQIVAISLQGLVNRRTPRVYAVTNPQDKVWLRHMLARGWVKGTKPAASPAELLRRFRKEVRGAVVTDPDMPASVNIATMIAAQDDCVIVPPRLVKAVGLPVRHDLRGRWKTNAAAYQWAFSRFWPRQSHQAIAIAAPGILLPRDYLIAHRVFTFWITGTVDGNEAHASPPEEVRLMEKLFAKMPANIAVLGYPWAGEGVGIGENPGVALLSQFGKYLVATDLNSNLTVHSAIRVAKFQQKRPAPPKLDRSKVYLSFVLSDGDNLQVYTRDSFPRLWNDPRRGQYPIGWSLSPSAATLIPAVVDYYYRTATPNDEFLGAVSGIGYMYPDDYAQRFRPADRTKVFDGFLDQTAAAMRRMDMTDLWIMGAERSGSIRRYAERIPNLGGLFPDYGRRVASYAEATYPTSRNVPVFRALTNWEINIAPDAKVQDVVRQIRSLTPTGRPAFMHAFVLNWAATVPVMEQVLKTLGPEYVAVRPDHLAALYRQELSRQKVLLRAPSALNAVEGRPITVETRLQNLTARSTRAAVTFSGALASGPRRMTLPPGTPVEVSATGTARPGALEVRVTGPFGLRRALMDVWVTPTAELDGKIPAGRLRFAGHFQAEGMPHRAGREVADPRASGGSVWATVPGGPSTGTPSESGFIVYGPYISLTPGRYVALFRLKRTGAAEGRAAALDVSVESGSKRLVQRTVDAGDLPEGAFRTFVLPFTYTSGTVETRVDWPGTAPLSVDGITLYEVLPSR